MWLCVVLLYHQQGISSLHCHFDIIAASAFIVSKGLAKITRRARKLSELQCHRQDVLLRKFLVCKPSRADKRSGPCIRSRLNRSSNDQELVAAIEHQFSFTFPMATALLLFKNPYASGDSHGQRSLDIRQSSQISPACGHRMLVVVRWTTAFSDIKGPRLTQSVSDASSFVRLPEHLSIEPSTCVAAMPISSTSTSNGAPSVV